MAGAAFELFFGYPDEAAFAAHRRAAGGRPVRQPARGPGPHAVGRCRRGGVRQAARPGSPSRSLPAAGRATSPRWRSSCTAQGLTRVVLCGMGGSSLAPEVICGAARRRARRARLLRPRLRPRAPSSDRPRGDRRRGLVKSGGTVETDSQRRAFEKAFTDAGIEPSSGSSWSPTPAPRWRQSATRGRLPRLPAPTPRWAAATPPSPLSASCPAASRVPTSPRLLDEAEAIRPALEADSVDNPGLRLGAPAGRGQPRRRRQAGAGQRRRPRRRLRRLGRAAHRRVHRQGRQGHPARRRGRRSTPRTSPPARADEVLGDLRPRPRLRRRPPGLRLGRLGGRPAGRADAAVGVRHRGRRPRHRDQPVRPARRRERQGRRPRDARRRRRRSRPRSSSTDRSPSTRPTGWLPEGTDTWPTRSPRCWRARPEHGYVAVQAYLDRHRDAALAERPRPASPSAPAGP